MDAFSGVTDYVRITAAKEHDRQFLYHIKLQSSSFIVFDKGYNLYPQFAKWTTEKIWFVTRMKQNALYHVTKVITDNTRKKDAKGVLKEQYSTLLGAVACYGGVMAADIVCHTQAEDNYAICMQYKS